MNSTGILTSQSLAKIVHQYRFWIYLVVAIAIVLIIIRPVGANEILQSTRDSMRESYEWWDDLWRDTFDPTSMSGNISMYSFTGPVRFLIGMGLIFWLYGYGKKMVDSQSMMQSVQIFTEYFLPIILILIFLANQGLYSRVLAYGLRDIFNSWSEGVLEQQIAGQTINSALEEQLLVEEVKNEIRRQANKCMQMPRPEVILPSAKRPAPDPDNPLTIEQEQAYSYLECLEKLVTFIEQKEESALNSQACSGGCKFFQELMKGLSFAASAGLAGDVSLRTGEQMDAILEAEIDESLEDDYRTMADFVKNLEKNGWMYMFSVIQWFWISFLEMSMWLNGLFAPIFVSLSLIPGKQKMFSFWLIEYLTIGLARFAYVALLGVVAIQISTSSTVILTQDQRFFMALGAFAPGVSLAVVVAGGKAAAASFRSQAVGTASVVSSALTGSMVTVAYSFSRYADRRR